MASWNKWHTMITKPYGVHMGEHQSHGKIYENVLHENWAMGENENAMIINHYYYILFM